MGEESGVDPGAALHTDSVGYTQAVSPEQYSALRVWSEETAGSSARPPDVVEEEEVGNAEAQAVGSLMAIPMMRAARRTMPRVELTVVMLLPR